MVGSGEETQTCFSKNYPGHLFERRTSGPSRMLKLLSPRPPFRKSQPRPPCPPAAKLLPLASALPSLTRRALIAGGKAEARVRERRCLPS